TRRREIQLEYNKKQGITPETIKKSVREVISTVYEADYYTVPVPEQLLAAEPGSAKSSDAYVLPPEELPKIIVGLEQQMRAAAKKLEFEKAGQIRDRIRKLREHMQGLAKSEQEVRELIGLSVVRGREKVSEGKVPK